MANGWDHWSMDQVHRVDLRFMVDWVYESVLTRWVHSSVTRSTVDQVHTVWFRVWTATRAMTRLTHVCGVEVASDVALATWHGGTVVLGSLGLAGVRVRDGGNEMAKQKEGNDANKVT